MLGLFLQDTHYRNQFETNSSRGTLNATARQQWEKTLFGESYNSAAPSTRPKYGVVNYDHDYLGCKRARTQYGKPTDIPEKDCDQGGREMRVGPQAKLFSCCKMSRTGSPSAGAIAGTWRMRTVLPRRPVAAAAAAHAPCVQIVSVSPE